jgi:hypothetical protein
VTGSLLWGNAAADGDGETTAVGRGEAVADDVAIALDEAEGVAFPEGEQPTSDPLTTTASNHRQRLIESSPGSE